MQTLEREQILEAIRLTEKFPPPGPEPADIAAQVLHDVALHSEILGDWQLSESLYARSLAYPTVSPRIPLGTWYRRGICFERMNAYHKAIESYRRVFDFGDAWPFVTTLAASRLGNLLLAAEEFEEAETYLTMVLLSLPHPEIDTDSIRIALASCKLALDRHDEAQALLEACVGSSTKGETALCALHLLAEIHERRGAIQSAAACYRHILENTVAPIELKAAALRRLEQIERKHK